MLISIIFLFVNPLKFFFISSGKINLFSVLSFTVITVKYSIISIKVSYNDLGFINKEIFVSKLYL